MIFNSFGFLASFAAFAVAYYAVPHRARWALLLAASVSFYATFELTYVPLLAGVALAAYAGGLAIAAAEEPRSRKTRLWASAVVVLAALFVFKYFNFATASVQSLLAAAGRAASAPLLPRLELVAVAGLSFFTFSAISYLADVYGRRLDAERHFGRFFVYVAFFPKLLAGPIERARPFLSQLDRPVVFNSTGVTLGLQLMLWGLFKKVVIADRLAALVDAAYGQPALAAPADLVLATYFFAFQLYCDFSGYSDIAIGASKVLGFDLMENFRRPYLSMSVPEFWSGRWHLSLGSWFRDYVYIPLGGSRVSPVRRHANVMAVFLLSGLWHGANWTFVLWGGVNGIYYIGSILTEPLRARAREALRMPVALSRVTRTLVTFHLILIAWVFFRAASVSDVVLIFGRIAASAGQLPILLATRVGHPEIWISLLLIVLLLAVEVLDDRASVWARLGEKPVYIRWSAYYALAFSLILFGVWNLQQFVYMQF